LKEKGVEVYFEEQNIYTLDSKGDLLITIIGSLAQEESRSISENVTWGKRKRMADGKVNMCYKRFLGYEKGADGRPQIVEAEAQTVRLIYGLFLAGKTYQALARHLTDQGIPTPAGKERWCVRTVMSILSNEKYKGDALLQKSFVVDFLNKKSKKNEGEIPQYYVENSHPAIISPSTFDLVQSEIARRRQISRQIRSGNPLTAKIVCAQCGSFYGSKVWHSNEPYRTHVWQCNRKYKNDQPCKTPHVRTATIEAAFIAAFNSILLGREAHVARLRQDMPATTREITALETKRESTLEARDAALEQVQRYLQESAANAKDQAEYAQRYKKLKAAYDVAYSYAMEVENAILSLHASQEKSAAFLTLLEQPRDSLSAFDAALWNASVEMVTVAIGGELTVVFKDGTSVSMPNKLLP
jgi:hypothetical protein